MSSLFGSALIALTAIATLVVRGEAQFQPGRSMLGPTVSLSAVGSAPAVGLRFERAQSERFGWGAFVDYWSYGLKTSTGVAIDSKYVALGGLAAYHFEVTNTRYDPFVGAALGYFIVSTEGRSSQGSGSLESSRAFVGGFGGLRYYVKETWALVGRVGFGLSFLTLGVDFRL